jgi:hypothetical protein
MRNRWLSPLFKELVAVVPIEDIKLLEALDEQMDITAAKDALADYAAHGGTDWEQVKAEMQAHRASKSHDV